MGFGAGVAEPDALLTVDTVFCRGLGAAAVAAAGRVVLEALKLCRVARNGVFLGAAAVSGVTVGAAGVLGAALRDTEVEGRRAPEPAPVACGGEALAVPPATYCEARVWSCACACTLELRLSWGWGDGGNGG